MSAQADEAPAFAFAFQARRFACDRCHRYKLKCERGPLLISPGIATPLGPCKRCGKARVECTSSNAATSTSSRRTEPAAIEKIPGTAKTGIARNLPSSISSATEALNDLTALSPFARPLLNGMDSTPMDPSLYLDDFDFDMAAIGEETIDHSTASSSTNRGLPSPNKSQSSASNRELGTAEHLQLSGGDEIGAVGPAMSDLLGTPPTDSLLWPQENPMSAAAEPVQQPGPVHPAVETLTRLSELQAFIFQEFGCIAEETLTKTFLTQGTGSCYAMGSASPDSGLVGKVLHASHRLIDILTSCGRDEPDSPTTIPLRYRNDSLSGSKRTHSRLHEDEEFSQSEMSRSRSLKFSSPMGNTLTTHLDFLRKTTTNPTNGRSPPSPKRTSSSGSTTPMYSGLLSPAKLTLLVCYVSLLGVYRSILTKAFAILQTPLPPSPSSHTLRFGTLHSPTTPQQPNPPHISTTAIMGFRIQLEMLAHA